MTFFDHSGRKIRFFHQKSVKKIPFLRLFSPKIPIKNTKKKYLQGVAGDGAFIVKIFGDDAETCGENGRKVRQNGEKWRKNEQKWRKMAKKMSKNGRKMNKI
jgi:malate/lactate dehydrogenase